MDQCFLAMDQQHGAGDICNKNAVQLHFIYLWGGQIVAITFHRPYSICAAIYSCSIISLDYGNFPGYCDIVFQNRKKSGAVSTQFCN